MNSQAIFGAEIPHYRTAPRDWERLIKTFADTGLRCVTACVQWGTHRIGPPDMRHPAGRAGDGGLVGGLAAAG